MDESRPLEVTVRPADSTLLLGFTEQLLRLFEGSDRISTKSSSEGVVLSCVWEPDLDLAAEKIRLVVSSPLTWSKPRIKYIRDSQIREPILLVEVQVSEDFMGAIVGDLSKRRGMITGIVDMPDGKRIDAQVPLAELFGYSAALRKLSRGLGTATAKFHHYEVAPRVPDPDRPSSAALRA